MKRISNQMDQKSTETRIDAGERRSLDADRDDSNEDVRRLRPLTILEHLTESQCPLTLAQLASLMGAPKSTVMRLLQAMESHGYVLHMPAERGFVPGPRSATLALQTLRTPNMRRGCRAVLRKLVAKLGESCNLTVPDAGRVLYVERVETHEPLRMHLQPGTWVPMHCTASGKLFLASLSALERNCILAHMPLDRRSPHTIVDRQALDAELNRIAQRGLGIDNEEFVRGMIAVATPVFGRRDKLVAAIACHAPTARRSLDELISSVPHLRLAADAMRDVLFPSSV